MKFSWMSSAYSRPWLCRFNQAINEALNIWGSPENHFFDWNPLRWRADIARSKAVGLVSYWVTSLIQREDVARSKAVGLVSYWVTSHIQILLLIFFQTLISLHFSSVRQMFSLKFVWINSKVFPLALKRMLLNYATAVPVHRIFNRSNVVIYPT